MKSPCFKFSIETGIDENWMVLLKWLEHFRQTGMPAGFVVQDGLCCVWRAGFRKGVGDPVDKPQGVLHMHVNGFADIWRANGGLIAKENDRRVQIYNARRK